MIQQDLGIGVGFNKSWSSYKEGFGNITSNYWLGLEKMHLMTMYGNYKLRVHMQNINGSWYSAEYNTFVVDGESTNYTVHLSGYSGDAGDSLNFWNITNRHIDGMQFTTFDRNNICRTCTVNYAVSCGGGWWYNLILVGAPNGISTIYFRWLTLGTTQKSRTLVNVRMFIGKKMM